jgi:cytochrome P450
LAKNPETQTKLYEEFTRVLGNVAEPSVDDLRKCDYLHAFLQESMRSKSTVPVNQRVSDNEDMKIGDYIIPKGVNVNIPNCVMFQDERWFGANTKQFRPERFIGNSPEAERARKSWIPFGENTRMCVGQIFALVELKAMIYTVITRTIVELEDPSTQYNVKLEKKGTVVADAPASKQRAKVVASRQKERVLDAAIENQLTSHGRLLAKLSSRPGQCGRCDGYILEGKELEFYSKQLQAKKKGKKQ